MPRQKIKIKKQNSHHVSRSLKRLPLRQHVLVSLLSVAHHAHTGRRLGAKHTSHGALFLLLLLTGIMLFSNLGILRAYGYNSVEKNGAITIGVTVDGSPPIVGAVITDPRDNTVVENSILKLNGSCASDTLVAVYNNGHFVGSTLCTSAGIFVITVQLQSGLNILQAQNYDGLNQPGPVTPQVHITLAGADSAPPVKTPVAQPQDNPCYSTPSLSSSHITKSLYVNIPCITRNLFIDEVMKLPILITGGQSPYALSVDWGDGNTDLRSVETPNVEIVAHAYKISGTIPVTVRVSDATGGTYYIQVIIQVNGAPTESSSFTKSIGDTLQNFWIEAPVPLYWSAMALAAGFWIGDIFQRRFGLSKRSPKIKRKTA